MPMVVLRAMSGFGPSWQRLRQDIDGEVAGDESGYSISLSGGGTHVAIGARFNSMVNGQDM